MNCLHSQWEPLWETCKGKVVHKQSPVLDGALKVYGQCLLDKLKFLIVKTCCVQSRQTEWCFWGTFWTVIHWYTAKSVTAMWDSHAVILQVCYPSPPRPGVIQLHMDENSMSGEGKHFVTKWLSFWNMRFIYVETNWLEPGKKIFSKCGYSPSAPSDLNPKR